MNGKIIAALIVILLIIIGGYFVMGRNGGSSETATTTDENGMANDQENGNTFSGSMRDLAMRGGSYKCTVSVAANEGAGLDNAVTYVSDGKVRTDAMSNAGGSAVESHMISDGEWMYMWSSSMAQGMKMKIPDATATSSASGSAGQGADYDARYSYDCDPWVADATLLTPPSDITFMEFSASGMQGMQGMRGLPTTAPVQ